MPANLAQRLTAGRTIRVVVGPPGHDQIVRSLHEDLLRQTSPYLKGKVQSLNNTETGNREREILLEHIDTDPFLQFVSWLHNQPLKVNDSALMVSTYLLAHHFEVEPMKNDIVDAVRQYHAGFDPGAYRKLIPMSELRRLCASLAPVANPHSNELLKYLVEQYTYYSLIWGRPNVPFSAEFVLLLDSDVRVLKWHLEAQHQLLVKMGITPKQIRLSSGVESVVEKDDDDKKPSEMGRPSKRQKLMIKNSPVPADRQGCCFHEHKVMHKDQPVELDD